TGALLPPDQPLMTRSATDDRWVGLGSAAVTAVLSLILTYGVPLVHSLPCWGLVPVGPPLLGCILLVKRYPIVFRAYLITCLFLYFCLPILIVLGLYALFNKMWD